MAYFPMMVDLQGKSCLVVGGGAVAYRKVRDLLQFGASVTVIAKTVCEDIVRLGEADVIIKAYEPDDIQGYFLVVAATDNEAVNRSISRECMEKNIPVNAVDLKDACSFIFPAIIKRDELVVSVSTGGSSPAGAAYLKESLDKSIPLNYEKNIEVLGRVRGIIMHEIKDAGMRRKIYYELLDKAEKEQKPLCEEDIYSYIGSFKS